MEIRKTSQTKADAENGYQDASRPDTRIRSLLLFSSYLTGV